MSDTVLLSGYYGFQNFGDEFILTVLIKQLRAWGLSPTVLSGDVEQTRATYGVDALHRTDISGIWHALKHARALISGGGGLFQDVTGPASPIYYGGLIQLARWQKVPVAFFGQGIGPLNTGLGRWLTQRALKQSAFIAVRDVKSQSLATQLTGRKVLRMADSVWYWQPDEMITNTEAESLAVSLRPWPQLQDDHIDYLAHCIGNLPGIHEVGVNLIDCQAGADIIPLAKLEQRLKANHIPIQWFSGTACIQGIAASSAFIGMRFHAVLVAAQLGVPSIALSYDPKVQLLAAGLQITDIPVETLKTRLRSDNFRQNLALANQETIAESRKSAAHGFTQLKAWLRA